jgi:hypothetical protein
MRTTSEAGQVRVIHASLHPLDLVLGRRSILAAPRTEWAGLPSPPLPKTPVDTCLMAGWRLVDHRMKLGMIKRPVSTLPSLFNHAGHGPPRDGGWPVDRPNSPFYLPVSKSRPSFCSTVLSLLSLSSFSTNLRSRVARTRVHSFFLCLLY